MYGKPSQLNYEDQEKVKNLKIYISNTEQNLRERKTYQITETESSYVLITKKVMYYFVLTLQTPS